MNVLVTGGAGYIGSHTVKLLQDEGHKVVVYDSLVKSHKESVNCPLVKGDLSEEFLLERTIRENEIEAVIHFAGFIEAGESMVDPTNFFENNISKGITLLKVMVRNNVKKIIFSSSAAVYQPKNVPLVEDDEKGPVSVYGETKLMFERILKWYDEIHGIKSVCLRYFNAAGAGFGLGENHDPETHLIPLVLRTALGKRDDIKIFGTDYNTPDGTCVRDYIHVVDLAKAHVLALKNLSEKSAYYNVGTGKGHSVKEIINLCREISEKEIKAIESARRPGDPDTLVANSEKIQNELGWSPEFGIRDIIKSAWEWHKGE